MKYTFAELHLHTAEVSGCASVSGADAPLIFKEQGYDLICVTDHYKYTTFWYYNDNKDPSWEHRANHFLSGYRLAKAAAEKIGLTVLLGAEICFDNCPNDYLVYGLNEEMIYKYPELYRWSVEEFSSFARKNQLFFAQAHPFRNQRMIRTSPSLLDGAEAYNTHDTEHKTPAEDMKRAKLWVKENNLVPLLGQDFHDAENILGAKTAFYGEVRDSETLTKKLHAKEFDFILSNQTITKEDFLTI
ncbi:MAG: PHP domain-containing protein [Clostridia bacterium]|nr:PHP domain-containing protein [Clostridia bacterium]